MRTNEDIVSIIEDLKDDKGLSLSELARRVGMAKSALSRYFNRTREFPLNRVDDFAKVLGVSPEYILGFDDNENSISDIFNQLNIDRRQKVYNYASDQLAEQNKKTAIIYGKTAAGEPLVNGDSCVEEKEVTYIPDHADVALIVQGDSMEPEFKDGSIVFYKKQENLENGEIGVFVVDGGVTLKKYKVDYDNQKINLQSLNDKYKDIVLDEVQILGKVVN